MRSSVSLCRVSILPWRLKTVYERLSVSAAILRSLDMISMDIDLPVIEIEELLICGEL